MLQITLSVIGVGSSGRSSSSSAPRRWSKASPVDRRSADYAVSEYRRLVIFDAAVHTVEFCDAADDAVRQYQQVIPLQRAYQPSTYHTAAATMYARLS